MKLKRSGTPKLCWADQVKFELGGHFVGQKRQKQKKPRKTGKSYLAIFGKKYWSYRAQILHRVLSH